MSTMRTLVLAGALAVALAATGAASSKTSSPELAFVRDGTIYLVRTDGTALRPVTRGFGPAWSPDGDRLAFARSAGAGGNSDLWVADADGRNALRLTRLRGGE